MALAHFNRASYNEICQFHIHKGNTMLLSFIYSAFKHLNHKTTSQHPKEKKLRTAKEHDTAKNIVLHVKYTK